jgi:signal transduction histidine kinase
MELIPADARCIVAEGTIVYCNRAFSERFSHRGIGPGARLNQLFPMAGENRPGAVYEDLDRLGKKRYFVMEITPTMGQNGEKASECVRIRNVTLHRVLTDIPRLADRAKTPKELFEKVLWLMRDTTPYLAFAGYIADGGRIELVASKGWTEKLKSYISLQDIAPDSTSLAGRAAYYRRQVVMAMKDYDLSPEVKAAILKLGGEYVVVTPLVDQDRILGVLTVINDEALTPCDSEALQSICCQLAAALGMKLREEEASARAEEAALLANISARAMNDAIAMLDSDKKAMNSAVMMGRAIAPLLRALNGGAPLESATIRDSVDYAASLAAELARAGHKRLNVRATGLDDTPVSPLLRFAVYEALKNSVRYAASPVEVDVRLLKERSGAGRLEISDNGPGIPDEFKSEVFRPDKANMKNTLGMGLYIAKTVAHICGGRIWVEDRVHGDHRRVTTVVVTIPPK